MKNINFEFTHNNSIARIILNSPKGNVLDSVMMTELYDILSSFETMNSLKMITLEGEGSHFSFGASVEEHRKEKAGEMLRTFHSLFYKLAGLGIPTAAKVRGQCLGGAMELCLMCNFIFADSSAKFGQPEIVLGVFPPPASLLLPMKIGSAKADELLLTGKTISADEAKTAGFVNQTYGSWEDLNSAFDEFINIQILPKSASSLRYAVKAARFIFNKTINEELKLLENFYVKDMMETHDSNEGINSFLEKRKPEWKNK